MKVLHPLLAIQVTVFPNSGISISLVYRHVVGDGRTMTNFIKSWASLFKSGNDLSLISHPCHDRAAFIKDPDGLLSLLWKQLHEFGQSWDKLATPITSSTTCVQLEEKLHATFVLGSHEIALLRVWITTRSDSLGELLPLPYVSTFVVTGAFIWICLMKTKFPNLTKANNFDDSSLLAHFTVLADYTGKQELGVPKTYIGNCLSVGFAPLAIKDLVMSENGLQIAAKAIMQKIKELETVTLDKDKALARLPEILKLPWSSGLVTSIAGSPKLGLYDTDFGWGKPKKIEAVHVDKGVGAFTLAESRDEKGGVEVGVSLSKTDMEAFTCIFELGLRNYAA